MIKPIPNLYGYYADSDGNILSRKSCNGMGKLSNSYRKLKTQLAHDGYNLVTLNLGGRADNGRRQKTFKVSRLVARTLLENFYEECVVMHLDNNRVNDSVSNLMAGTFSDNNFQKVRENRQARGSRIGVSKLTRKKVIKIKQLLKKGSIKARIAIEYGVSKTLIGNIESGKCWKHVCI